MDDILELNTRRKIYKLIKKNPGLHLSKIAEILNLRISHVEYHLHYMERNGFLTSLKETGYIRYYCKEDEKIGHHDKKILTVIRQEIPLTILILLLKNVYMRHKELLDEIRVSASTLSYHLQKLVKKDIIQISIVDGEKRYSIIERDKILNLIVRYKPYNLFESFNDVWKDLKLD
jgi:predicted transcriptional regulator